MPQLDIDTRQIAPLIRVLTDENPYLDAKDQFAISLLLKDFKDLKEYGEIRWRGEGQLADELNQFEQAVNDSSKPVKSFKHKLYNYNEAMAYIEKKYDVQTRGYKRDVAGPDGQKEYRDFWHWLLEHNDVHRTGSRVSIPEDWRPEDGPWWVVEIFDLIVKEFFPGFSYDEAVDYDQWPEFWVSW